MTSASLKRILCYGDSLTAGFCHGGTKFVPYANSLKENLKLLGLDVEIDHYGFSGWTTDQLLSGSEKDKLEDFTLNSGPGIKKALINKEYNILILMAGTNDLSIQSDTQIFNNLKKLIEIAISEKVSTLSIGIPDSAYIFNYDQARSKRDSINKMLSDFANESEIVTFIPCPIEYFKSSDNFDFDGLHFSEKGYREFGKKFSGVVKDLLE